MGHVALQDVRLAVGGSTLLSDLTFAALPGELIAIVGANGAGKTTLLRALAGFVRPVAGRVTLDGIDVATLRPEARARAVTLIGTDAETPAGTSVCELVAMGRFAYRPWWDWTQPQDDRAAALVALERVDLRDYADRSFETLSAGERQRVWLALALAQDTRLVLLDEPTAHLDPRHALDVACVMRGIARDTTTAFVVSHDLNEAATIADRIAVLGEGRLLICAPPGDALEPEILEHAYGIAFDRIDSGGAVRVLPRGYRPPSVLTGA